MIEQEDLMRELRQQWRGNRGGGYNDGKFVKANSITTNVYHFQKYIYHKKATKFSHN